MSLLKVNEIQTTSGDPDVINAGIVKQYALLQDQKSQGTYGGQPPNQTAYNERDLNTEVFDTGNFVSLSSNDFTLIAGTYFIHAMVTAHRTNQTKCLIFNVTDGTTLAYSQTAYCSDGSYGNQAINMMARTTITASKAFDIRMRVNEAASNGYGFAAGHDTEIYTQVFITKEA
tara:strand:+ start:135 stop:653 length:519 start_codon:yes stop_codon:yes gene_type:complete